MDFLELEGKNIVLRKARVSDYKSIYKHILSDEDIYKWMLIDPLFNEEDAIERINEIIEIQKNTYTYFVALKATDEAIGICGINEISKGNYEETGICISKEYQTKGFGKELLSLLLDLAFNKLNAKTFTYAHFKDNNKSKMLAMHFGFEYSHTEEMTRAWDNKKVIVDYCILTDKKYKEIREK